MNKRLTAVLLSISVLLSLSGCGSLFKKEYLSVSEYADDSGNNGGGSFSRITSYDELKNAIIAMVYSHKTEGRMRFMDYSGSLQSDLAQSCSEVKAESAIASYAIDYMPYYISRIATYYEASIYITYKHTQSEISAIRFVSCKTELIRALDPVLDGLSSDIAFSTASEDITADEVTKAVNSAYAGNPVSCVVQPNVTVTMHPESGLQRIIEIELEYGWKPTELKKMKSDLTEKVDKISENIGTVEASVFTLRAYNTLARSCSYDPTGYSGDGSESNSGLGSTAYGALCNGLADSKGIALAFSALCKKAGIKCYVVNGNMDNSEHSWNIVKLENGWCHIDVSENSTMGSESEFMKSDSQMHERYWWDAEAYPSCSGRESIDAVFTPTF